MAQMTIRAEPIDRLRDDVRLLGELVGEVLREQGGEALFEAVEHVRTAAIQLRSGAGSEQALLDWAERQSTQRLMQLVRAFSTYFHLINLAEQHHRVRTLRERQRTNPRRCTSQWPRHSRNSAPTVGRPPTSWVASSAWTCTRC